MASANVFISYSSDTKRRAEELTTALEGQGIEPWVDFKDLHPGQRWKDELERAIDAAQWLVILVGPEGRVSRWQEAEWSTALARTWTDERKKLLPVVFGEGDAPPFLRNWVSLRIDPGMEAAAWTGRVLDVLRDRCDDTAHGMGPKDREERRKRLDELSNAAEWLREGEPNEPPRLNPQSE